jgi:hypothetical protein
MTVTFRSEEDTAGGAPALPAALVLARHGFRVVPLHTPREDGGCSCGRPQCESAGKHPRTRNGSRDASADAEQVRRWFEMWPSANVGIATGDGLVALDVDPRHGGDDTLVEHERQYGALPETLAAETGGGGSHYLFKTDIAVRNDAGSKLGPGLDIRGQGGLLVVEPSLHASGRRYVWQDDPSERSPAELPGWLADLLGREGSRNGKAPRVEGPIVEGDRHRALVSLAGTMRRRGMPEAAILAALREMNATCVSRQGKPYPLPEQEVCDIASGVARYAPEEPVASTAPPTEAKTLEEVVAVFERWLYMPDPGALYAVLGTVAANLLPGDPAWLLLVGAPGTGKSEILQATTTLPFVHPAATLTEPALLSGTSKRETASDARGGLLRTIGDFGVVCCKDFGSILNIRFEDRASVLAALREVYDGAWTRHVGTDGGRTLAWSGKLGFIGGATPTIDRHHAVMGAMGERFTFYRLPEVDQEEVARGALAHSGREKAMRKALSEALAGLFADGLPSDPRGLSHDERERLVGLATLVVRCRSAVERDGYSREIELVPGAEAPTRLVIVLERLLAGLDAIALERGRAWQIVSKVALDSVPALRLAVIDALARMSGEQPTTAVAEAVRHPTQTTRRALEDLTAHAIVARQSQGKGKADTWQLSPWARTRYGRVVTVPETSEEARSEGVPEISGGVQSRAKPLVISPLDAGGDISGKVAAPTLEEAEAEAERERIAAKFEDAA